MTSYQKSRFTGDAMPLLDPKTRPLKPAEYAEHRIIEAILDRSYAPGDTLPGERVLAQSLGVTRPTIRETLQRLAREGWITIAHGRPTRVNDYLTQGGLGLLATLARYGSYLSPDMVCHLLETRTLLLPGVAALAAANDAGALLTCLSEKPDGETNPSEFARFDWALQKKMVVLSGNPVLRMIFNDFEPVYQVLGERYFETGTTRAASLAYYRDLRAALERDPGEAEALVARAMARAQALWKARP